MIEQGFIQEVVRHKFGSYLVGSLSAGATTITVEDAIDFDESGGTLTLNGTNYTYTAVDMLNNTITLFTGLVAGTTDGDYVAPYPAQFEKQAIVIVAEEGGDAIPARIPHDYYDKLKEGIRDEVTRESVTIELIDGEWTVTDIIGDETVIDGTYIDRTTLPNSLTPDGLPPATSPTPIVLGGVGTLFVRWTPIDNANPVTYEVHISETSGFTPSVGTKAAETGGGTTTLRTLADGTTSLSYDTTYYVKIVAKDMDGAAPASAEASGQMVQVNSPDIAANYVYAGTIFADQIEGAAIRSDGVIATSIKTSESGARVEIDPKGLTLYDAPGGQVSIISTNGESTFKGNVQAKGLTVTDSMVLESTNNRLAVGGVLRLETATQPPGQAPSTVVDYERITLHKINRGTAGVGLGVYSLNKGSIWAVEWDGTAWLIAQQVYNSNYAPIGVRIWRHNTSGGYLSHTDYLATWYLESFTVIAGTHYALTSTTSGLGTNYHIRNLSTGASSLYMSGVGYSLNATLGNDGTNLLLAHKISGVNANVRIRTVSASDLSTITSTVDTNVQIYDPLTSIYKGSFDFGATRFVFTANGPNLNDTNFWVVNATGTQQTNETFPMASEEGLGGYDGTNFWTFDKYIYDLLKHTNITWTTQSATWSAGNTWATVAAETPIGPVDTFTMKKRARLAVTTASFSGSADRMRVYVERAGTGETLHLQGESTTTSFIMTSVNWTSAAPPTTNTFPSGTPATIRSTSNEIVISADGTINLGNGATTFAADGSATVNRLIATSDTDANVSANNRPALIVGSPTGNHLRIDGDEIISMTSNTATGVLWLNKGTEQAVEMPATVKRGVRTCTITQANTPQGTTVTFPAAFPTGVVPVVMLTPKDVNPNTCQVAANSVTNTGFIINAYRTNTNNFDCGWIAWTT